MRFPASWLTLVAAASTAVFCLAACSTTASKQASPPALQSYSCCSSQETLAVRHPGETIRLHWIATPLGPSSKGAVSAVRLEAGLSGPFASVTKLKASKKAPSVTAPVVVTTDRVGEAPVSVIVIPEDAPAGVYNLTTTIHQDGGQVSAGSVIQVSAKDE